jgi:agmatine/peptidylarginine deiminase
VLVTSETDADGHKLEVVVIESPTTISSKFKSNDFAAGYINFYVVNGAVIAPEFGDTIADEKAKSTLQDLFPDRDVVQLNIDAIAAGGGHPLYHPTAAPCLTTPIHTERRAKLQSQVFHPSKKPDRL